MSLDLNAICIKHGMNPDHRAEFFALVLYGKRPGKEMRNRMKYVANYKAALDEAWRGCPPLTPICLPTRRSPSRTTKHLKCPCKDAFPGSFASPSYLAKSVCFQRTRFL